MLKIIFSTMKIIVKHFSNYSAQQLSFYWTQFDTLSRNGQTLIAHSVEHAKTIYFERSGHTPLLTEPKIRA